MRSMVEGAAQASVTGVVAALFCSSGAAPSTALRAVPLPLASLRGGLTLGDG